MGKEVGTLRALGVNPGDVVRLRGGTRNKYQINRIVDGRFFGDKTNYPLADDGNGYGWELISRASGAPKTWGEMTDAEKGELLLGWQTGGQLQYWDSAISEWLDTDIEPTEFDADAYRIRPEPKRETMHLYGGYDDLLTPPWRHNLSGPYKISFDLIDDKPITGTFRNDAGDVITVEEIQ